MKKSLLAIVLAVATVPLTFAAQQPTTGSNNPAPATASTTKKHVKKTHKVKKPKAAVTPAAKPAK